MLLSSYICFRPSYEETFRRQFSSHPFKRRLMTTLLSPKRPPPYCRRNVLFPLSFITLNSMLRVFSCHKFGVMHPITEGFRPSEGIVVFRKGYIETSISHGGEQKSISGRFSVFFLSVMKLDFL